MGTRSPLLNVILVLFAPLIIGVLLLFPSLAGALIANTPVTRVSEALPAPFKGANSNSQQVSTSSDGRYTAFQSAANNLVSGDSNGFLDIFLFDNQTNVVTRASTSSVGVQANGDNGWPSISSDGRYLIFESNASNLVAGDTNFGFDIFLKDLQTGTTTRVSTDSSGAESNANSGWPAISQNGRYVAFHSDANNLVVSDTNSLTDLFIKDTQTGSTTRANTDSSGTQAVGGGSYYPSFSNDGRYVVFQSTATNLVAGDTNALDDIFLKDTQTGTTTRISTDSLGAQATGANSFRPDISSDGRYVVFYSAASNLVAGDTNTFRDVFIKDTQTGSTTRLSTDSSGVQSDGQSYFPKISADGRYVAFESGATNLVAGDTNGRYDVFRKDTVTGTTIRVSTTSSGAQVSNGNTANSPTSQGLDITADGRYVAYNSQAIGLHADDTNSYTDIFLKDTQTNATILVSTNGGVTNTDTNANNNTESGPSLSANGRYVAFSSAASNLVANDTNNWADVFVRDMQTGVTSLITTDSNGVQGNNSEMFPVATISDDGRYVAFASDADNLVSGDTNGFYDVFVKDRQTGATTRVSTSAAGVQANGALGTWTPVISADGRYVVFNSQATNLLPVATNGNRHTFLKDTQTGTVTLVSTDSSGNEANGASENSPGLAISTNNRFIAFESIATNLVPGGTISCSNIFKKDIQTGVTTLVSSDASGVEGNSCNGGRGVSISGDGRYVAFTTCANNLVPGFGGNCGVYRKDTQTGAIVVASTNASGQDANNYSVLDQYSVGSSNAMSDDGRYVAFCTQANNFVPEDTDTDCDIFVKDLATGDISLLSESNDWSYIANISRDGKYIAFFSKDSPLVTGDNNGYFDILYRANPFVTTPSSDNFSATPLQSASGGNTASVLPNDIVNNAPVSAANYILTIANDGGLSGVVINADGTLTIPVNAVGGSYTVTYQMCEAAAPSFCVTSTANVSVLGASTSTSTNAAAELADTGISLVSTIAVGSLLVIASILVIKRRYIYKYNVKL
ncbi:MAG: hypothetical protein M3Q70_00770 [bacterium]|nr:hypothetical protein [bacterium]